MSQSKGMGWAGEHVKAPVAEHVEAPDINHGAPLNHPAKRLVHKRSDKTKFGTLATGTFVETIVF